MIQGPETIHLIEVIAASVGTAAVTIGGLLGIQKYRNKNGNPGGITVVELENVMLKHNEKVANRYNELTAAAVKEGESDRKVMREGFKALEERWDRLEVRLDRQN